jgi:hypothetical protein
VREASTFRRLHQEMVEAEITAFAVDEFVARSTEPEKKVLKRASPGYENREPLSAHPQPDPNIRCDGRLLRPATVQSPNLVRMTTDGADKRESSAGRSGHGRSRGWLFLPRRHHSLVGLLSTSHVVGFPLADLLDPIVPTWSRLAIRARSAGSERCFT